ncbi:hypothetical protein D3C75_943660 [compost metagenome]
MLLRRMVREPPRVSSSSTTPVTLSLPCPFLAGAANTSISSRVPMPGPYTARPLTSPICGEDGILRSVRMGSWLLLATHSTSAALRVSRPSVNASPAANWIMLTASRPLVAYCCTTSMASGLGFSPIFWTASRPMTAISSGSSGRK